MHPNLVILLLALSIGLQPVSTDLYLPGLPGLALDLQASVGMVQYTLSGLLLAFGISQLLWGPFSDKVGRRPIMLVGLVMYTVSAVGCVLSPTIEVLVAWRVVQGVAMGAVITSARAVVRDLYTPLQGAKVMSKAMTGLGLMACTSPPLGGFLSQHWGWRVAMTSIVTYALFTMALVAWRFKETITTRNPNALHLPTMLRIWGEVLRHPTFRAFALLSLAAYGALFTYLASSSFIFIQVLHLPPVPKWSTACNAACAVPRRSCWTTQTCGAASARTRSMSGPRTTTMRSNTDSQLASRWRSIDRPATLCSVLGRLDFIRVPRPAARMMAVACMAFPCLAMHPGSGEAGCLSKPTVPGLAQFTFRSLTSCREPCCWTWMARSWTPSRTWRRRSIA